MQVATLQSKIYDIRGQKVLLDLDLALLYEVETKVLNQSVKIVKGFLLILCFN
jgi:hypothetical protein